MLEFTVYRGLQDGSIKKDTTKKPDLTGDQVLLKVTASGLCGTDLHYKRANMVLGHEGAGIVQAIGPAVHHLQPGDRVGWGYIHDACGHCLECLNGDDNYCDEPEHKIYGVADTDQGSFASHAVWREAFLFRIPEGLSDEEAAPLQCGGATIFNALEYYGTRPTDVVGVIGVGGLGHLGIQFAAKMGCEVIVISGSDNKKSEALKLGAKHFIATKGATELKVDRPINRLLVTTSVLPDWDLIVPILAPHATIYPITISGDKVAIPALALVNKGLTVQGSAVAPRGVHERMLQFAALHGIKPVIEKFPMTEEGIQAAFNRLESGKMRYRGVLVPQ